jgi:hypothetical protein
MVWKPPHRWFPKTLGMGETNYMLLQKTTVGVDLGC